VTRPFGFEGKRRLVQAEAGIEKLRSEVDTLIVIPNDRLLSISDRHVSVLDAFKAADQVLLSGVQGITDLITTPGLINLDFADVKSVMSGAGSALMGTGSSRGDDRAVAAAEMAISSPLLEASIDGAHGVLLSIQGGSDLGLFEINEAAQLVSNSAAVDANIIFGAVIDDALGDEVRVTVIAAGLDEDRTGRVGGRASAADSGATISGAAYGSNGSGGPAFGGPALGGAGFGAPAFGGSAFGGSAFGGSSSGGSSSGGARFGGSASPAGRAASPAGGGAEATAGHPSGNGVSATGTPASAVPVGMLGAPVPDDRAGQDTETPEREAPADQAPAHEAPSPPAHVPSPPSPAPHVPRQAPAEGPGKTFDVAATRRRPVVFEEDDDLDVPDFLK
jgi:cell division protein FtsZ